MLFATNRISSKYLIIPLSVKHRTLLLAQRPGRRVLIGRMLDKWEARVQGSIPIGGVCVEFMESAEG
jgi:hypothetical protein